MVVEICKFFNQNNERLNNIIYHKIATAKNPFLGLSFWKQKGTSVSQSQEDINVIVFSALSSRKACLSLRNFNF